MNTNEKQKEAFNVLKALNKAISTSRLYPPEAPQVNAAVRRGYSELEAFVRRHGQLQFSLKGDRPHLLGAPLDKQFVDSAANISLYRQLRLLGFASMTIKEELDYHTFEQILTVFRATLAEIERGGGGLEFVSSQGLADCFSIEKQSLERKGDDDEPASLKVRPELVAALLGKDTRSPVLADLKKRLVEDEVGIKIIAAAIAAVLKAIQAQKTVVAASDFPKILARLDSLLPVEKRGAISQGLARFLSRNMRNTALCVLLTQRFSQKFGALFYADLVASLEPERFAEIVAIFDQRLEKAGLKGNRQDSARLFGQGRTRLLKTPAGKRYLQDKENQTSWRNGKQDRLKRQCEAATRQIVSGNYQILLDAKVLQILPAGLPLLEKTAAGDPVVQVLRHLVDYIQNDKTSARKAVLECALTTGCRCIDRDRLEAAQVLTDLAMRFVRNTSSDQQVFELATTFLQKAMLTFWKMGDVESGDKILLLFFHIRSGKIPKDKKLCASLARIQDRGVDRADFPRLLKLYTTPPQDMNSGLRLVYQGPVAIRFLLKHLVQSQEKQERFTIMDLLKRNPGDLISVVCERLSKDMPWYGKRNLLKLLGEVGSEREAAQVVPYLNHSDYRVQREALFCLVNIAGTQKKKLLLEALDHTSGKITVQIIEACNSFCDRDVAARLGTMLNEYPNYAKEIREPLLLALIDTLGRYPDKVSQTALQAFCEQRDRKKAKRLPETVWSAARKSLHFLKNEIKAQKKAPTLARQLTPNTLQHVSQNPQQSLRQTFISGLPEERSIRNMLARGEKEQAISRLFLFIEQIARRRNFALSERLKGWLAEVSGQDLTLVLKAGALIAREKKIAQKEGHLDPWGGLYDNLSSNEFETLFNSFIHKTYAAEELIVDQGTRQESIFFVCSGEVKLYCEKEGNNFFISTVTPGEIIGVDVSSDPSYWDVSAVSVEDSSIMLLPVALLDMWKKELPGLVGKLQVFCERAGKRDLSIVNGGRDRRRYERHKVALQAICHIMDSRGKSTGISSQVGLLDISQGGLAYLQETEEVENLKRMLGRKVRLDILGRDTDIKVIGSIIAVRSLQQKEKKYSLHVTFERLLEQQLLQGLVQADTEQQVPLPG